MAVEPTVVTTAATAQAHMVVHTSKDHHHNVLPTATGMATQGTTVIRDLLTRALNRDGKLPDKLPAIHLLTAEVAIRALNSPLTMADSQDTGEEY